MSGGNLDLQQSRDITVQHKATRGRCGKAVLLAQDCCKSSCPNEAYYKCDVTFAGARREILNRRDRLVDRRRIKKGCVTLFKSFPTILTYFSSCTACAGLDDAPAMSLQCFVSA